MKNLILFLIITGLILISRNDSILDTKSTVMTIEQFDAYGDVHNSALANIENNFELSDYSPSLSIEEKYRIISDFNADFVKTYQIDTEACTQISYMLRDFESIVNTKVNYRYLNNKKSIEGFQLLNSLDELRLDKAIGDYEYNLLSSLATDSKHHCIKK